MYKKFVYICVRDYNKKSYLNKNMLLICDFNLLKYLNND